MFINEFVDIAVEVLLEEVGFEVVAVGPGVKGAELTGFEFVVIDDVDDTTVDGAT